MGGAPTIEPDHGETAVGRTTDAGELSVARPMRRSLRPHPLSVIVLIVGLVLVGVLSWASWLQYDNTENRLLLVRTHEAGSVLTVALPTIQTPLASAAELAEATSGDPQRVASFLTPYVGPVKTFVSASLWSLQTPGSPRVVVGASPVLASYPSEAQALFARASRSQLLSLTGSMTLQRGRMGYAYVPPVGGARFAVYAETALPANHRLRVDTSNAFSDLDYALYLGDPQHAANLVATSMNALPVTGRQAATAVHFGDMTFTLVMRPKDTLGSSLSRALPWVIAGVGTLLAMAAALATERLIRRRRRAEGAAAELADEAGENRRLYAEQRGLAQVLQRALLPVEVPTFSGVEVGALYLPGVGGVDIGGDWYDIIRLDDTTFLLVVGDVSGRGLRAATVMASLRYAIRAYAAQGDPPETILHKLSHLLSLDREGHFATILCAVVDVDGHTVTVANAGHPDPLLIVDHDGQFVATDTGVPVGAFDDAAYGQVTVRVPASATLVAFTDGLVERRAENLDVSLERLRQASQRDNGSLERLLNDLVRDLTPDGSDDDIALVGVKWQT